MIRSSCRAVVLGLLTLVVHLATLSAEVVISEIMYHPASTNRMEEYVELFNPTAVSVSLSGWQFTKGVRYVVPTPTTLVAGGYLVVAADAATFHSQHPGVTNYVAGWTGTLSDDGDHLVLADAQGLTVNEVSYAPEGPWAERRLGPPDS